VYDLPALFCNVTFNIVLDLCLNETKICLEGDFRTIWIYLTLIREEELLQWFAMGMLQVKRESFLYIYTGKNPRWHGRKGKNR
jgi:hypothetical protein